MVRHKLDSVNEFARRGYGLRIRCVACMYLVEASAIEMMRELHRRHLGQSIDILERRLKCSRCGHRGAQITPFIATIPGR